MQKNIQVITAKSHKTFTEETPKFRKRSFPVARNFLLPFSLNIIPKGNLILMSNTNTFVLNLYLILYRKDHLVQKVIMFTPWAPSHLSGPTLCDPLDCSPSAPLPMGFSRQEYWSGLPCSPPRIFPPKDRTHVFYVSCIGRRVLYH